MTNLQNLQGLGFSDELQYAIECGVKFDLKVLESGDIQVSWNDGKCVEILSTDSEETTEVMEVEAVEVVTVEEIAKQFNLTAKEQAVLKGIIDDQFEDGLPPFTESVAKRANLTQKQAVGVISSLYKKGFLESYLDDASPTCQDMYHLTSEWFEKFKGYC